MTSPYLLRFTSYCFHTIIFNLVYFLPLYSPLIITILLGTQTNSYFIYTYYYSCLWITSHYSYILDVLLSSEIICKWNYFQVPHVLSTINVLTSVYVYRDSIVFFWKISLLFKDMKISLATENGLRYLEDSSQPLKYFR